MSVLTILLFFIYTYGLGYTATRFLKNSDNFLERNLMRVGIGLGIIPFLGILINLLHLPLDWKIFLILSLIVPLIDVFRSKKLPSFRFRLTKSDICIFVVLLLFFASLFMYTSGAFKYPWLEDDDPWLHAEGIKYVSIEKDVFHGHFMYIDPYPPGYDLLFGVLHQTSPSLHWTMKFFNALIISLGIIFFYFFAKRFIGNRNKALFATFILVSIPSYLSHFIWAHSLVVTLLFPAMYCVEMLKEDKKWMYISILVIASICLTQPTQPIKFAVLFGIYFLVRWLYSRRFDLRLLASLFGGYILSSVWWFSHLKPMFFSTGAGVFVKSEVEYTFFQQIFIFIQKLFPTMSGTATRAYSFNEIIFAKHQNMINNPIGIGIFIMLLLVISLVFLIIRYRESFSKKHLYLSITLLWAIFTFLGFNSATFNLPIGLFGFRFWMLFAIPASILVAEGLWFLFGLFKKYNLIMQILFLLFTLVYIFTNFFDFPSFLSFIYSIIPPYFILPLLPIFFSQALLLLIVISLVFLSYYKKSIKFIYIGVLLIVVLAVLSTSAHQKYSVNTAMWPFGARWTSPDEVMGYVWIKENNPIDTKVFTFADNAFVLGLDMYSCTWCSEVKEFHKIAFNESSSDLSKWLKRNGYKYLAIGGRESREFGVNETNIKINQLGSSGLFRIVHSTKGALVFEVV